MLKLSCRIFFSLITLSCFGYADTVDSEKPIYTFGDSTYQTQLQMGKNPIKLGFIESDKIPSAFPKEFLEADGSYPGGRIYATIPVKQKGIISQEDDWGVYQLQGNWDDYAYELRPNEFYLRQSTLVVKRVLL
jgi:hypothetical protein